MEPVDYAPYRNMQFHKLMTLRQQNIPCKQTPLNKKLYKSILLFIKNAARIEGARSVPRKRYGARLARNPTQRKVAYEFAKQTR